MAKKKRSKPAQVAVAAKTEPASQDRRRWLLWGAGGAAAVLGAGSIHAYDVNKKTLHDLTVIGSGKAVVVQIHNPGCPTCRKLKAQVQAATSDRDDIHYRLADISTAKGRSFQDQYDVPNITLLYFDAKGNHLATTQGLQPAEQLRLNIDALVAGQQPS